MDLFSGDAERQGASKRLDLRISSVRSHRVRLFWRFSGERLRLHRGSAKIKVLRMPHVPGLRSPYDKVGRLVYFGRMLDKIRLHVMGKLPREYQTNLGDAQPKFNDGRCCRFLGIEYPALVTRTLEGGTDEDILAWAHANGVPRTDEECVIWNRFMTKAGWRDDRSARLQQLVIEYGLAGKSIETVFDLFDYDEGRDPAAERPWLRV